MVGYTALSFLIQIRPHLLLKVNFVKKSPSVFSYYLQNEIIHVVVMNEACVAVYKWLHNFVKALDEILKKILTDLMPFVGSLEPLNDPLHLLLLISSIYSFIYVPICFIMANGCIIMQLIVSSHENCVIESPLLKKDYPKV